MNTTKLNNIRDDLKRAREYMVYCETQDFTERTVQTFKEFLAKTEQRLQEEINYLSWKVWPETGRPYMGDWAVESQVSGRTIYVDRSYMGCLDFIKEQNFPDLVNIFKWPLKS